MDRIRPEDPTGMRQNITDLIELQEAKKLTDVVIMYRMKEGDEKREHIFHNGEEENILFMCELCKKDIIDNTTLIRSGNYDRCK